MTALHTLRLDGDALTLVLAWSGDAVPGLAYLGATLPADEDLAALAGALQRGRHESQADAPQPATIWPQTGRGWLGPAAADLRRGDRALDVDLQTVAARAEGRALTVELADAAAGVAVRLDWRIGAGDMLVVRATLTNVGDVPLAIDACAALALPLPVWATRITDLSGRWSGEMRAAAGDLARGAWVKESRGGRPGFSGAQWLLVGEPEADADRGRLLAAHLAWSGDHVTRIERDNDSVALATMGARLDAGEIVLAPGTAYETPAALVALSTAGRNGIRCAFHRHLRAEVLPGRADWGPRKVHLNSWEALGFDLDTASAIALAERAAAIGVERFVLDDGWFGRRRDDSSSLGDWTPDPQRFPGGLAPLIDRVHALGMDFGLWVEPEMVSPDSDLYRAHPDWCLHAPGRARPAQRNQLVLDLARPEVGDHTFAALDALLRAHPIAYLKWDHNRELFPRAGKGHAQIRALHALLDRLRAAHPAVEIESCASGGGRIDAAMLARCHRVWPSDNNDPLERLRLNASYSLFLPREVLGNHVGPDPNPITGRVTGIDFRARVAMFGHMGVEADPASMSAWERERLAAHIALYKAWRDVIHEGLEWELTPGKGAHGSLFIAPSGARAIGFAAQTGFAADYDLPPLRLTGLDPSARYRVTLPEPWPRKARRYLADPDGWRAGRTLSGRALAESGLALPLAHPETAWLIALEKVA
ncbi:MAG: alpha-galactosidase [Alphaproteobacteria bacterium]|nr:alpha-galactosidase [Alphaproteobacteria bacterium]